MGNSAVFMYKGNMIGSSIGETIQYATLPTASADNVGKIAQYVGTTTQNYTNGYFYKCVNNSGTYSWQRIDVQPFYELSTIADANNITTTGRYLVSSGTTSHLPDDGNFILEVYSFNVNSSSRIYQFAFRGFSNGDHCIYTRYYSVASSWTSWYGIVDEFELEQIQSEIAPIFDETESYAVGDYVYYNDPIACGLYICTTAHTGEWDDNDFELTSISSILKNLPTFGTAATKNVGTANGVAELDANGKVPTSQLPSYVDDVLEYASTSTFPATGETGKIYVALDTNKTYRWSGSEYVEISASLALGETDSSAYRGDRGAAAYTHAVTNKGIAATSGLYKITTNAEGHVTAVTAVTAADIEALGFSKTGTVPTDPSSTTGLNLWIES